MTYIYDILLNFNRNLYDVYEWNKNDNIIHIRKIPIFKIKSNNLLDILNNKIEFENEFLMGLYKKTEFFNENRIGYLDFSFLLTDGKEVVALKCNKNHIEYSKLLYEEEVEVIEYSYGLKFKDISYNILSKIEHNIFKTRNEYNIRKYIYKQLDEIIKNNDDDKLNYIYLECFNKKSDGDVRKQIYIDLENNWDDVYLYVYNFLKKNLLQY